MNAGVCAFDDETDAGRRLARALDARFSPVVVHRFPDGETMPKVSAPAAETTIVYRSLDRPNLKLVDLLLAADAWRRAGAKRLILVAPYLCYLRQDAVFEPGEPLSRDVIAPLLGARFDAVVTVAPHLHRTADLSAALGAPAFNVAAADALGPGLPEYVEAPLVVGPDSESAGWARAWALKLGGQALTLEKRRLGDRRVEVTYPVPGRVEGKEVLLIDDVASTGQTLVAAIRFLRGAGASSIDVAVVHALFTPRAAERLQAAGARRIMSTDSVRHPTNAVELAPWLAAAVRRAIAVRTSKA
ncbi:MAG: ribose-phosphate diphosphokinase [Caulobacterales bacterium]